MIDPVKASKRADLDLHEDVHKVWEDPTQLSDEFKARILKHLKSLERCYQDVHNENEFQWLYHAITYWESYLLDKFSTVVAVPVPKPERLLGFPKYFPYLPPSTQDQDLEAEDSLGDHTAVKRGNMIRLQQFTFADPEEV